MGCLDSYRPELAMFALQVIYASITLIMRAALTDGMSPRVFVVYRQAISTLLMAPIAYIARRRKKVSEAMGMRSLGMIFLASLVGVTINQNLYAQGVYLASSSLASAMSNLIPAITFLMAASLGLEKVDLRSLRSWAKISGTIICVSGAASMALLKGPRLSNMGYPLAIAHNATGGENWLLGSLFLMGACCCWSFWLILQVPMSASYPDHLSLSAWMCFFAAVQSAAVTWFLEGDPRAWVFDSNYQIFCCIYAGSIGSGITYFVQSWCISKRGPLFSAMFSPLCTVMVTILACILLHERLYLGSLVGAAAVVGGLYAVLWGKAEDYKSVDLKPSQNGKIEGGEAVIEEPLLENKLDESNN